LFEQIVILVVIVAALVLFAVDYWRYDVVSMMALLVVAIAGLVPPERVFLGFGHPAVITVVAVLVISHGLWSAGTVDALAGQLGRIGKHPFLQLVTLTGAVTVASGFMNNVGAMAIMIPVALRIARRSGIGPSRLLMPMAFSSLFGGCLTLIGTPPNIIIASFRREEAGEPFTMFDFLPVGATLAVAGLLFLWSFSWRLVPVRKGQGSREQLYEIEAYLTEVCVPAESAFVDRTVLELEEAIDADVVIVGLVRGNRRLPAPPAQELLRPNDTLIVEGDAESLKTLVDTAKLRLAADEELAERFLTSDEVSIVEGVVGPDSGLLGRTSAGIDLRRRYGVNLLAVSRQGHRLKSRLSRIRFRAGDILLLQGDSQTIVEVVQRLGCLPLAERDLRIGKPTHALTAAAIFVAAIVLSAAGWVPVPVAFVTAAGAMVMTGLLPLREVYERVDWPIVVLLGALIPVGEAFETTGGAATVARIFLATGQWMPEYGTLAVLLLGTMLLSNIINNAAAVVLMAPIGIGIASSLGASVDPFLMSVAIGAALPFLTPIGHQSNLLVMGPGGYAFGDYWRLGLPLSLLVVAVSVPVLLVVWPLHP
jgi:di/tricarboxylate transporter